MKRLKPLLVLLLSSLFAHAQHWAPLPFQFDKRVTACIPDSETDSMYIIGNFANVNGVPSNVIQWDGDTGITYKSLFGGGGYIDDITTYHGKTFICVSGIIARQDDTGWFWTNNPNLDQAYNFFRIGDRLTVMMEHLDYLTNTYSYHLSVWDGSIWKDTLRTDTVYFTYPFVSSIEYYKGSLNLVSRYGITGFDGTRWANVGGGINTGGAGYVSKLLVWRGSLFACGSFFESEGAPGNDIARWDGTSWHRLGDGLLSGYGNGAIDMTVYNDELYVVGNFSEAGGVTADGIAKWDGQKWCTINDDFGGGTDNIVTFKGNMYVSGGWNTINGNYYNHLAKWIGGTFGDSCSSLLAATNNPASVAQLIYPNPANNKLFIKAADVKSVSIVDPTGRLVRTEQYDRNGIDISTLPNGIYIVRQLGKATVTIAKLIIQH